MKETNLQSVAGPARILPDLLITLMLWLYFTAGFLLFFAVFYLAALLFSKQRETAFQKLNQLFFKGLFRLMRMLMPWRTLLVQTKVKTVRSAVIVCNHLSYLDPLLLMALFPRHKTIVKSSLFSIPIFGQMLVCSGYMPSDAGGKHTDILVRQMDSMNAFLAAGGNLFIFPEGTRSRSGRLGNFNKGAFKIAKKQRAPIAVFYIDNTDTLFQPGRFLFNTCGRTTITVELLDLILPDSEHTSASVSQMMDTARNLIETRRQSRATEQALGGLAREGYQSL